MCTCICDALVIVFAGSIVESSPSADTPDVSAVIVNVSAVSNDASAVPTVPPTPDGALKSYWVVVPSPE
jgi:hypothetical protein